MRLRKRHAWGGVLIALFALPVLCPAGVPALEDPAGGFFAWFAGVEPLNPRLWDRSGDSASDSPRVRELQRALAEMTEARYADLERRQDAQLLLDALELERLPVATLARVLRTSDPVPSRRSILIDLGTRKGVAEGYPVVAGGVFLGRVHVARGSTSVVRLVTDAQSRLEVSLRTVNGRRVTGVLRRRGPGTGPDELEATLVRLAGDVGQVAEDGPVFTSNADPLVPPGLLVGYVSRVSDPEGDGFPTVLVRPALDLARSVDVQVLMPREER